MRLSVNVTPPNDRRILLHRGIVMFAACVLGLGPLGLLQSVAWTGMALDYSARYGLAGGLQRTFDGQHPCKLCKKIAKARQEQSRAPVAVSLPPLKLVCLVSANTCAPMPLRMEPQRYFTFRGMPLLRLEPPPFPPPRTLAA